MKYFIISAFQLYISTLNRFTKYQLDQYTVAIINQLWPQI